MEHIWAGESPDARGSEPGSPGTIGEPFERVEADDPLGDEAAFPSTWQHLTPGDAPHD